MDVDAARLFKVIDELRGDIKNLCHRITKIETQYNGHIDQIKQRSRNRERILYGVIAIITISFTAYQFFFS